MSTFLWYEVNGVMLKRYKRLSYVSEVSEVQWGGGRGCKHAKSLTRKYNEHNFSLYKVITL